RYAIARWGLSKAVSELLMTPRLAHPAAAVFHAKLASSLALWPIPRGMAVRTANPLACEPALVTTLGSFKRDPNQALGIRVADKVPAADASPVHSDSRNDPASDNMVMQVQARDARATTLALLNTFRIAGPMMGREPDNLAKADTLVFDVWIPPDAAP